LTHSKRLLTPQRVLLEIEAFAKDLDVQGPTFPYDSVSKFLVLCLKVASQDVRLYRMQFEEKALSWIVESWKVVESYSTGESVQGKGKKLRLPAHTIKDVLLLLESICGLSKRSDIVCRRVLPDCSIVDAVLEENKTAVIRDFIMHARLPTFHPKAGDIPRTDLPTSSPVHDKRELVQPLGRERRIAAFLLKSLGSLIEEWESQKAVQPYSTAEHARTCLDFAVIALYFESLLRQNGTKSNKRVIQSACRLFTLIVPIVNESRWASEEKMLILLGLDPLISVSDTLRADQNWNEILSPPNERSGIKRKILTSLKSHKRAHSIRLQSHRRELQRIIFESADVSLFIDPQMFIDTLAGPRCFHEPLNHSQSDYK
jgi:ataxia telangiectasia mutated family protein